MSNTLNQVFNIVPVDSDRPVVVSSATDKALATETKVAAVDPLIDFGTARENLTQAIKIGTEALGAAAIIAGAAQTPEHFDSVASLLKSVADAAKTLMTVHKDLGSIGKNQGPQELHNHVHFSGSTDELSRMMKERSSS